jgi:septum formation protein
MIILASNSPRRKDILTEMGLTFTIIPSAYVEDNTRKLTPAALTEMQARGKAEDVARRVSENDIVIGADTVVVLDGEIIGKPKDEADAAEMLRKLSGRTHSVVTGVAVVSKGKTKSGTEETKVTFRTLTEAEIVSYIKTGEPMDKAGAYALQGIGGKFIADVLGSRSNVIGLPKDLTAKLLGGDTDGDDS